MTLEEKLQKMLSDDERAGENGAAVGDHLTEEDLRLLIENMGPSNSGVSPDQNGHSPITLDKLSPLRNHLAGCRLCLDQFKEYYEFFAPAGAGEPVAGRGELEAAWQAFAPRLKETKARSGLWARLFSPHRKMNYFAAFGWGFAALLMVAAGLAALIAWQAKNENAQLAAQLERQKQSSEERLKDLDLAAQKQDLAEQEKTRLAGEKDELQKRVAELQTEIERAKEPNRPRTEVPLPANPSAPVNSKPDNSLVAVNTPIFDVFPAEAVVRSGAAGQNKLVVPKTAKNIVLILNAAGRAEFPVYRALLVNSAGKTVWSGGGLKKDANGNFTLTLSRAALKTGSYKLKLAGAGQTGAPNIAEYSINIEIH